METSRTIMSNLKYVVNVTELVRGVIVHDEAQTKDDPCPVVEKNGIGVKEIRACIQ